MATFLDLAFFQGLQPILIFLIMFAIVFAILSGTNILGQNKNIHGIIAFVIGIFMMLSGNVVKVITTMIPWFLLIAVFAILLIIILKMFGIGDETLSNAARQPSVYWTIIIISLILLIGSISSVYGQQELSVTSPNSTSQVTFSGPSGDADEIKTNTGDFDQNAKSTIYHPRMLGFIVMIIIGLFTVQQLSRQATQV